MDRKSVTAAPQAASGPVAEHAGQLPSAGAVRDAAHHVDARELDEALLTLRERIAAAPLPLDAPGVAQARAARKKLLVQIDDYLLPRLHRPAAPILVALVGSTGAGKSTLVNSIVGQRVSATGIRRPTTNSPVLACHPDDAEWFAENRFMPTLPRVRQEGLARPGRDGLLVIAASDGMPRGIALLDTPDIDSVVRAHYEFAHQFLDASDLWLFMTTAARYADAPVWDLLQYAKERGAALGIVLSRVPEAGHSELVGHFCAMLEANGIDEADRFVIPETVVTDGMLPAEVFAPVRSWLEEAAVSEDRRVAVLTQTMSGILDTFRARVPELAAQVEAQVTLRAELQGMVESAYDTALASVEEATRNGSLLEGEVLARWQDFAGTGELLHTLQVRHARGTDRPPRKRRNSVRLRALKAALRSGLESLVVSLGDQAAEKVVSRWRGHPAGAALLASLGNAAAPAPGGGRYGEEGVRLSESSPDLARRAARAVSAWQDHVLHMVRAEGAGKRAVARVVSFDDEAVAAVLMIDLFGYGNGEATASQRPAAGAPSAVSAGGPRSGQAADGGSTSDLPGSDLGRAGLPSPGALSPDALSPDAAGADAAGAVPRRLLDSLLGPGPVRAMSVKARGDLRNRLGLLFSEEMLRFAQLADTAGVPDGDAAGQLYQAAQFLENAR
jgi:energy-coupling factor transporter ATP-binding protein EcfA2